MNALGSQTKIIKNLSCNKELETLAKSSVADIPATHCLQVNVDFTFMSLYTRRKHAGKHGKSDE